ncbi:unnamed protein product [Arctogadus glacialis]
MSAGEAFSGGDEHLELREQLCAAYGGTSVRLSSVGSLKTICTSPPGSGGEVAITRLSAAVPLVLVVRSPSPDYLQQSPWFWCPPNTTTTTTTTSTLYSFASALLYYSVLQSQVHPGSRMAVAARVSELQVERETEWRLCLGCDLSHRDKSDTVIVWDAPARYKTTMLLVRHEPTPQPALIGPLQREGKRELVRRFEERQGYEGLQKKLKEVFSERRGILQQLSKTSKELDSIKGNLQVALQILIITHEYAEARWQPLQGGIEGWTDPRERRRHRDNRPTPAWPFCRYSSDHMQNNSNGCHLG